MNKGYHTITNRAAILFDQHFHGLVNKKKIDTAFLCASVFIGIATGSLAAAILGIPLPAWFTIAISTAVAAYGAASLYRAVHVNVTLSILAQDTESFRIAEDRSQITWQQVDQHGEIREVDLFDSDGFTCCRTKQGGYNYYVCSGVPTDEVTRFAARLAMRKYQKAPYKTPWISVYFKCHEARPEEEDFWNAISWNSLKKIRKGA